MIVFRCTRCDAPMGDCSCWDAVVTLRCPQCKRTKRAERDPTDPPGTVTVEAPCDRCDDGGGFPETMYFDSTGKQILPSDNQGAVTK